jgi:hypothetical protein
MVIIVGIVILGIVWRLVRGVIRLVFTVGVLLLIGYLVLNALR